MDQVKIGKFIAELRRRAGLTQEALGKKIGVTNKTISRWENGNYLPDIEMLQLLANEFQISIHELLSGERLSDEDFRKKADENVIAVSKVSAFSEEEKRTYFKKKWRKEHIALLAILFLIFTASLVMPFVFGRPYLAGAAPLIACMEYGYQNNKMMIYVENNLYNN